MHPPATGPAFIVIPMGLGILAIEFAWARRRLVAVKARGSGLVNGIRNLNGRG